MLQFCKVLHFRFEVAKGVMVLDREEHCTFLNPEAERLLGWTLAQLKGL